MKRQVGFTLLETLLILLSIALLSFAGYYVWTQNRDTQQIDNAATSQQQTNIQLETKDTTTKTSSEPTYLSVEEWGVKFELNDINKDATYSFENSTNSWAYISTPRMKELADTTPICTNAHKSLTINRAKVGDDLSGSPWSEEDLEKVGTKLEDYYYFVNGGEFCSSDESELNKVSETVNEIGKIRASFNDITDSVSKL